MVRSSRKRPAREIRDRADSVVALLHTVALSIKANRLSESGPSRPSKAMATQDQAWIQRNLDRIFGR